MIRIVNNATSRLTINIAPGDGAVAIAENDVDKFPPIVNGSGDWFPITVTSATKQREIMYVVGRIDTLLVVERGKESTPAVAFSAGASVEMRLTAGTIYALLADANLLTTGLIKDNLLPERLRALAPPIDDADAVEFSGVYSTHMETLHIPIQMVGYLTHAAIDAFTARQVLQNSAVDEAYMRRKAAGLWTGWESINDIVIINDSRYVKRTGTQMTGQLVFAPSVAARAGARLPPGDEPQAFADGDIWTRLDGQLCMAFGGQVYELLHAPKVTDPNATLYPVGAYVVAQTPDVQIRNSIAPVRWSDNDDSRYAIDGPGDLLEGEWQARGSFEGFGGTFNTMYQRVL